MLNFHRSYLITRHKNYKEVYGNLKETTGAVLSNLEFAESDRQKFKTFLDDRASVLGPHDERFSSLHLSAETLLARFDQFVENFQSSRRRVADMMKVVEAALTQLENDLPQQFLPSPVVSVCKNGRWYVILVVLILLFVLLINRVRCRLRSASAVTNR